ncbi:MAG: SCO family protein [Gemmatimonadales bacterium]
MRFAAAVSLVSVLALGCTRADRPRERLRGTLLPDPRPKPDFTLVTSRGDSFDFRRKTDGTVTLLFFGYTYCPDICPVHMANIAAALEKLPPQIASALKVVFVTTDPARDTPERLRNWLNSFDTRFIGLIGPLDEVNAIQREIGLAPAMKMEPDSAGGGYLVGHAAQVVAFTSDNLAHIVYPFGTRQVDWAHDLPILIEAYR